MIDYIALRTNDIIKLMPFMAVIICLILLEINKKLDTRRPSMFLMSALFKVLSYPILIFSPYLFFLTLSEDALYMMITGIQLLYLYFMIGAPLIIFLYMFEYLLSKFMMIDIYMDGFKIKWGKLLK